MPAFVETRGVDEQSLRLAGLFMDKMGDLCKVNAFPESAFPSYTLLHKESWMPEEVLDDTGKQRHFSNVLYALSSRDGMGLLRVVDEGRVLLWNRREYNRDEREFDEGKNIEDEATTKTTVEKRPPGLRGRRPRNDSREYRGRNYRRYEDRDNGRYQKTLMKTPRRTKTAEDVVLSPSP